MRKPGWKTTLLIFALLLLAGAVVAGLVFMRGSGPERSVPAAADVEAGDAMEKKPVNVAVIVLEPEDVEESFTLPGTLEAWENLTLSLEQAGPVTWIGPSEGDRVRKGQEILRIDTQLTETQHARNLADFELKKKQFERVRSLLERQLVSEREFEEAENSLEIARATLEHSSIALAKSTLVSPIDGILDSLLVDRGEFGSVGTPAAVVVKVDKLRVNVDVPEKDVSYLKPGEVVKVLPAEFNDSGVGRKGDVIHVGYLANDTTRTYEANVEIDNSDMFLRPGMIVRVRFVRRVIPETLLVPLYAVIDRDDEKIVFVVENGVAVRRQVRLGPIVGGKVVIFGGVQAGESLVVKGQQLLVDGVPVSEVEN